MAYNGSGTFTRAHNWINDRNDGVKISADRMDDEDDGFATGLTTAICKDGQTTTTARVPFAVGVGLNNGAAATPALTFTSDTDLGLYRKSADTCAFAAGGAEIFAFDADGITMASGKTINGGAFPRAAGKLTPHENLIVKYVTAATLDIDADALTLFNSAGTPKRFTSINLTVDISTGNAKNSRGTGIAETGNVWYYIWVGEDEGTPYAWLDTSTTGANDPDTTSTYRGLVGMVRNDGSSNFKKFLQRGTHVRTTYEAAVSAGAATTYTAIDLSAMMPPNASEVEIMVGIGTSTGGPNTLNLYISSSGATTTADTDETFASFSVSTIFLYSYGGLIPVSTAQQIEYYVSGSNARAYIYHIGHTFA